MNNTVSIKLTLSQATVECEGSEYFVTNKLTDLVALLKPLLKDLTHNASDSSLHENGAHADANLLEHNTVNMSISSIASKLGVNSGPSLVIATCAYIDLVLGKDSYEMKEIRSEMKKATRFCTKSMEGNLGCSLNRLVKRGELIERSDQSYALNDAKRSEMLEILQGRVVES